MPYTRMKWSSNGNTKRKKQKRWKKWNKRQHSAYCTVFICTKHRIDHVFYAIYTLILFAILPVVEWHTFRWCLHIVCLHFVVVVWCLVLSIFFVVLNSFTLNGCIKLFSTVHILLWLSIGFRFDRDLACIFSRILFY